MRKPGGQTGRQAEGGGESAGKCKPAAPQARATSARELTRTFAEPQRRRAS
jgi:hypothetical protein